ncbi:MAG: 3-dehydroquinate synthase [Tuberibacillus sp.]
METLRIETKTGSYPVFIDKGLRKKVADLFGAVPSAYLIITDDQVGPIYLENVRDSLKTVAPVYSYVVPAGEPSKSFDTYKLVIDECVRLNLDRQAVIIALGGGVIGDLAGFAAATYLRGIDYIQMPTTLLAHDSSVGGKVGINHEQGKNLIGAFYPPKAVIFDTETLSTLSLREWRSGFVEMIKHAFLESEAFLNGLREAFKDQTNLNATHIEPWLSRAIAVKAKVVALDEKESGLRATLNLGHTLGHAIEKEMGYGELTHGEAVAIGLIFALKLSEKLFSIDLSSDFIRTWFCDLGLPVTVPETISHEQVIRRMHQDKKRRGQELVFILLREIGQPIIQAVPESFILQTLQEF